MNEWRKRWGCSGGYPYSTNKSDINIYEKDTKTSILQEKIKGLNDKVEALEKEIAYLKLLNQNGIKI
jgi:hypothetical protein